MRLLIATRNRSKFAVVADLFHALFPDAILTPLYEIDLRGDVVEEGSIEDRAKQKAVFFFEQLGESHAFDGVIGVDDGFQVDDGDATPHSKEITDDILSGKWPVGTEVLVLRAFALCRLDGSYHAVTTRLPFTFMGNPQGIIREEGVYPLEQVLAPEGMQLPWAKMPKDVLTNFIIDHSRAAMQRLFSE